MATQNIPSVYAQGYVAGADLSASKDLAVKFSSGKIVVAGAGEQAIGFLKNNVALNGACDVATAGGGAFAKAGGTIAQGALLKVTTGGKVIAATTDEDWVIARAMHGAANNDVFDVMVLNGFFFTP